MNTQRWPRGPRVEAGPAPSEQNRASEGSGLTLVSPSTLGTRLPSRRAPGEDESHALPPQPQTRPVSQGNCTPFARSEGRQLRLPSLRLRRVIQNPLYLLLDLSGLQQPAVVV